MGFGGLQMCDEIGTAAAPLRYRQLIFTFKSIII
jgi:hypothetical protein